MKKVMSGITAFLLIISLALTASAEKINIKIDGKNENKEWFDIKGENLFKSEEEKGNGINSAVMKYIFDPASESCIYFMFFVSTKVIADESLLKAEFSIDDGPVMTVTAETDETVHPILNDDNYLTDACLKAEGMDGYVLEIKFVNKSGLGKRVDYRIKFGDENGILSKMPGNGEAYLDNPLYTTTSTTEKTTVKKTTKRASESKTTTERTTRPTTTYKSHLTTKAATAKTTVKAEKAVSSRAAKKVTSERTYSEVKRSETVRISTTAVSTAAGGDSLFNESGLSRAAIYKIAVCAGAVILFGILGLWAIRTRADADRAEKEEAPPEKDDTDSEDKDNNHGE